MVWCCPRMVILCYNLPNARPWQTYRNAERAAWHDKTSRFVLPSSPFCNARTTQPPTAWPSSSWQQRRSKLAIRKKTLHCTGRYWRPACIRAHPGPGLPACQPLASSPLCSSSRRLFRRLRHRPQRRGPCRWLPRRQRHPWANPRR